MQRLPPRVKSAKTRFPEEASEEERGSESCKELFFDIMGITIAKTKQIIKTTTVPKINKYFLFFDWEILAIGSFYGEL